MSLDLSIFNIYLREEFKPILCRGYHPKYNRQRDYDTAKQAITEGFTKNDYQSPTSYEIKEWIKAGGWIGWLIPIGMIVIDTEDPEAISYIEALCRQKGIKPPIHVTNNGKHYFFRTADAFSASSKVYTKSGFAVTYRVGGKSYLILAPINERTWEVPLC